MKVFTGDGGSGQEKRKTHTGGVGPCPASRGSLEVKKEKRLADSGEMDTRGREELSFFAEGELPSAFLFRPWWNGELSLTCTRWE
ncbi:uncharacterized protein J3R85_015755 [Psidium guajava]|nr:uncharacterized protein J3R85_015755 [Psidium guajava]